MPASISGSPPQMPLSTPRIGIRIYTLTGAVVLLLVAAAAYDLISERRRLVGENEALIARLSDIVEEQAKRVVGEADVVLRAVAAQIVEEDPEVVDPDRVESILHRFQRLSPEIRDLAVFDRFADRVAGTRAPPGANRNIADRGYFKAQRDQTVHGIFMAEPIVGAVSRQVVLPFSRRLEGRDGAFVGIVAAVVDPDRFRSFHRSLGLQHAGTVSILDRNGTILVRTPDPGGAAGRSLVAPARTAEIIDRAERGVIWARSPLDGSLRLAGYRAITGLPLMVSVSFSGDSILAPWERRALTTGAAVAAIVIAVFGFAHGIVLAARRERALQEARAEARAAELSAKTQLADAMDVLADGIALYDVEDRLVFCNRRWLELYPQSADVMRPGVPFEDIIRAGLDRGVYPEAAEDSEAWLERRRARRQSPGGAWELRYAGGWRQITERRTAAGGIISLHRDITERKQAELLLRARAQQNAAVAELGRIALTGPAMPQMAEHAIRLTRAAIDAERTEVVLLPEAAGQIPATPVPAVVLRAVDTEGTVAQAENGRMLVAASIRGMRSPVGALVVTLPAGREADAGEMDFLSAVAAVLSQQRIGAETQAALIRTQRLESVGRLTGGVAHDFNNLLTVVIGNADLLAEQFPPESPAGRAAQLILRSAERGADVVQRLLVFARRQPLASRPVDVNALIIGMSSLMRHALTSRITVDLRLDPSNPIASTDPGQVESALMNLVINARDAMADGGTLEVSTRRVTHRPPDAAGEGDFVEIVVTDSGHGMSPEIVAQVFEPFFTTKEPGKGTGLGLSMVHGFARQSGGDVRIESVEGLGTHVRLYLPASATPAEEERPSPAPGLVRQKRRDDRLLVVEDDPLVRRYVCEQLEGHGFRVTAAERADEALDILQGGERFDLLFSDVVMPGVKNGWTLAEAARKLRPDMAILLTTGHAIPPEQSDAAQVNILHKPYRPSDLIGRIEAALDSRSSR